MVATGTLTVEAAKQINAGRDFVLFVDQSASMQTPDCGGASRWSKAIEVVGIIIAKLDELDDTSSGGIDLVFFGQGQDDGYFGNNFHSGVTVANYSSVFPSAPTDGGTYLGAAMDWYFRNYFANRTRPVTMIVLLDGDVTDRNVLTSTLNNAAKAAGEGNSIAVGMWQLGYDAGATKYLNDLDNMGGDLDIVDAQPFDEVMNNLGQLDILIAKAVVD